MKERMKPRIYKGVKYVLGEDIKKFHGNKWFKEYVKVSGTGNTGIIIPENDKSHNKAKEQYGIYYNDYSRFADVIDYNKSTYFD